MPSDLVWRWEQFSWEAETHLFFPLVWGVPVPVEFAGDVGEGLSMGRMMGWVGLDNRVGLEGDRI